MSIEACDITTWWSWLTTTFCWAEQHPGLGSWAQAVGTVGAVFGADWLARRSERRRESRARAAERAAAANTATAIRAIITRCVAVIDEAAEALNRGDGRRTISIQNEPFEPLRQQLMQYRRGPMEARKASLASQVDDLLLRGDTAVASALRSESKTGQADHTSVAAIFAIQRQLHAITLEWDSRS